MKKWITAVAIFTFAATLAFAQEDHGPRRGPGGPPPPFAVVFGEKLALTDAQKDQIGAIEKKTREDNASFFESSHQLMEEARAARKANDTAKLESLKPLLDTNHEKMKQIHDEQLAKIVKVLTDSQRSQFEELRKQHEAERDDHPPRH
jgi:Spy/CpxP family protein refolding chaperone